MSTTENILQQKLAVANARESAAWTRWSHANHRRIEAHPKPPETLRSRRLKENRAKKDWRRRVARTRFLLAVLYELDHLDSYESELP